MSNNVASILQDCLAKLEKRRATVDDCLTRHPELADELEPLLLTAEHMRTLPKPALSPEARVRIETRLLDAVEVSPQTRPRVAQRSMARRPWSWALAAVSAALIGLLLLSTLTVAAAGALPGSPLYSVKQVAEAARLWLSPEHEKAELHLQFAQRRLQEMETLAERGRFDPALAQKMTEQTEAALEGVGKLPVEKARPLLDQVKIVLTEQEQKLSALKDKAPLPAQESISSALEAGKEQASRAEELDSQLPVLLVFTITKTANPGSLPEPGGVVEFAVEVTNTNSSEPIFLTSLVDDLYGDLNGQGTCVIPPKGLRIDPGASYACFFSREVLGDAGVSETNTVTAVAADDEGNQKEVSGSTTVTITDLLPTITVDKQANRSQVPEPGGTVRLSVRVVNTSPEPVGLASLEDDRYGDLNGRGTCALPPGGLPLGPGESYACSFVAKLIGDAGDRETNTVMAAAWDNEGNRVHASASATVTITDVPPAIAVQMAADRSRVPEPGGMVEFRVGVTNEGVESVALKSLVDDLYGDLSGKGTCAVPPNGMQITPGASYTCAFKAKVAGNAGESEASTVTAVASDNEGNQGKGTGSVEVTLTDVIPVIALAKTASPSSLPEPGGTVEFKVGVTNSSVEAVLFTSLMDSLYGNLNGKGTCAVPPKGLWIAPGASYTCAFQAEVVGDARERESSTVTAVAADDEGNQAKASGSAVVTITDVPPVIAVQKIAGRDQLPEPGGKVKFTVRVKNTSVESVALNSLMDNLHGNLNGQGTCTVPQGGFWIAPGVSYACTFEAEVVGNAGTSETSRVTAVASDNEGNRAEGIGSVKVTLTDLPPVISLTTKASLGSLPEPGGMVGFALEVTNTSVEPVALESLVDDLYGDLNGQGTCVIPQGGRWIAPGASYACAFQAEVLGNAGENMTNITTAIASDDEGNQAEASASATVALTDVLPTLVVTKKASPSSLPEPGGPVEFAVKVTNTSVEPILLTSLVDNLHGDLNGQGTCALPRGGRWIALGASYACTFQADVLGNAEASETDTVTAMAADDEENQAEASASAKVTVTDVLPTLTVANTASPTSLPEPGGTVEFAVKVTNTSVEPILLTSLVDDLHGDLNGQGTCAVPRAGRWIAKGASYACTFQADVLGNAGEKKINTVKAVAADDEGNQAKASASATVTITDVLPTLAVTKTASPSSLPEPGGTVRFAVEMTNTSPEPILFTSLVDDLYGDLNGQGSCVVPQGGRWIAPGASYACTFQAEVLGNAGASETSTVTAVAADDEGNQAEASASAKVTVTDALPTLAVAKTASPSSLPEPGGTAEFSVEVTNTSPESVLFTSLVDDLYGDLNGQGSCVVPPRGRWIAPGASYTCAFQAEVVGNAGASETSTVTAMAADDEGNQAEGSGSVTVTIADVLPTLAATKTVSPSSLPEPGGPVEFAVQVTNTSVEAVLLTSLVDDPYGDLNGQGTCVVPPQGRWLAPGASYACTFQAEVLGNAGARKISTVMAVAADDEGNQARVLASATATLTDVLPTLTATKTANPSSLPEPGGMVEFAVEVTNTSVEAVFLTSLVDDPYGDLNGQGTCVIPQGGRWIAPGASYACAFQAEVLGNAGASETDTVAAVIADDEGNQAGASANATVTLNDVLPTLAVAKTASPSSLPEPGGTVEFSVEVTNTSPESILLTSLVDDLYGNLNGRGTCVVPQGGRWIAPGASYACAFQAEVLGNAGASETDTVAAVVADDEGNEAGASASATVTIADVLPILAVAKTASPSSLPEPGGMVEFSVEVTNAGPESILLTSLVDDLYGDLNGQGTCLVPPQGLWIVPGASYACAFQAEVLGNAGASETDTVTAIASDDEGNQAEASASATVTIADLLPTLAVAKTASPESLPEPGGTVEFSVEVTNTSVEAVLFTSLVDDLHGDLNGQGSCVIPPQGLWIAPGASYACAFQAEVLGNAGASETDTVTAVAADDEGNQVEASASATVTIADLLPILVVAKTASSSSLPEPGGPVEFAVEVTNMGVEAILLTSLVDDLYGDLNGQGSCVIPLEGLWIAPEASYTCTFQAEVLGNAGMSETSTVTAVAADDEGNEAEASGSATVTIIAGLLGCAPWIDELV